MVLLEFIGLAVVIGVVGGVSWRLIENWWDNRNY